MDAKGANRDASSKKRWEDKWVKGYRARSKDTVLYLKNKKY